MKYQDPEVGLVKNVPVATKGNMGIDIVAIILTMNQKEMTLQCLDTLLADDEVPFHVLIWDNGSKDATAATITESFPDVMVHYHQTNLGVASGRNAAASLAIDTLDPTYLLFLDNDMLVEPGFVSGLLKPILEDERVVQTQAKLRFMDERSKINDGGGAQINFAFWRVNPVGYGEEDRGQYDAMTPCISCGGAMMVRADVFQQLGGFDAAFDPFGPEDLDFSLRLRKAGYLALYAPQAVAYHKVSHTYGADYGEDYVRLKAHNWYIFMRRHAAWHQKLTFYLVGIPYLILGVAIREGRRGNFGAIRGLFMGAVDLLNAWATR